MTLLTAIIITSNLTNGPYSCKVTHTIEPFNPVWGNALDIELKVTMIRIVWKNKHLGMREREKKKRIPLE